MRKFCLESIQPEPLEKAINETFSHQVNYARRKFKRTSKPEISSISVGVISSQHDNDEDEVYSGGGGTLCRDST